MANETDLGVELMRFYSRLPPDRKEKLLLTFLTVIIEIVKDANPENPIEYVNKIIETVIKPEEQSNEKR